MKNIFAVLAFLVCSATQAQQLPLPYPCLSPAQVTSAYATSAPNSSDRANIRQLVLNGIVCAQYSPKGQAMVNQLVAQYGN